MKESFSVSKANMGKNSLHRLSSGRKGALYTAITLILLLSLMAFSASIFSLRNIQKSDIAFLEAIDSSNDKFSGIERAVLSVDKNGYNKVIDERNLPFSYNRDENYLEVIQELPLKQISWNSFFDLINGFEVFLEDENYSNAFDGTSVSAETVQNSSWLGDMNSARFLLLPSCLTYSFLYDSNALGKSGFSGTDRKFDCLQDFNWQSVSSIWITVKLKSSSEDFDTTSYGFENSFNPLNPYPYVVVYIDDSNCLNCSLSKKTVSFHLNPNIDNNIVFSCSNPPCTSQNVKVSVGKDILFSHLGRRLDINSTFLFRQEIESFEFYDFNFSLNRKDFGVFAKKR